MPIPANALSAAQMELTSKNKDQTAASPVNTGGVFNRASEGGPAVAVMLVMPRVQSIGDICMSP